MVISGDNKELSWVNKALNRVDGVPKVRTNGEVNNNNKEQIINGVANNKVEINGVNKELSKVDGVIRVLINGVVNSKEANKVRINGVGSNKEVKRVEINGEANNRVATSGVNRVVSSKAATKEAGACRAY